MKAVCFDGKLALCDKNIPLREEGDVLIRVALAGICNTDHEVVRGYVPGFNGILGHEFIGVIAGSDDSSMPGKRVTADINISCGKCEFCRRGLPSHCIARSVLGIRDRDGAMAEYVVVPQRNIIEIPPSIPDRRAVFIEPLAAALEILEQIRIREGDSVLLIGDGKLAQLIARVLKTTGCDLSVVGKHRNKLSLLEAVGIKAIPFESFVPSSCDVVIEASGSPSAFALALSCAKPRGTVVLKSTYAGTLSLNPSGIVVNELTLVGSRCGRLEDAIAFLEEQRPELETLISAEFPLADAADAFLFSERPESLKVILRIS